MQKKKLIGLFIVGLLFSISLISFIEIVSAQGFLDDPFGTIQRAFSSGEGFGDGFSRFLFAVIIAVLVYAVTDKIPGMNKQELNWARWVIAIIVAYFGSIYLNSTELLVLISTYSALGFTLGAILPFLILIFFSYDLYDSPNIRNEWVRLWLLRGVWIIFGVFLFIRIIGLSGAGGAVSWIRPGYWFLLGCALFVIIFAKAIGKRIRKGKRENIIEGTTETSELAAERERNLADAAEMTARRTGNSAQ